MHRTRNAAYPQGYRGFKSLPVRHHPAKGLIHKEFGKISGLQPPEWYARAVSNGSCNVARPRSASTGFASVPDELCALLGKTEEKQNRAHHQGSAF